MSCTELAKHSKSHPWRWACASFQSHGQEIPTDPEFITGGMQHLYGGIYGRWEGAAATDSDYYEIVVYGQNQKQTNASSGSIELSR